MTGIAVTRGDDVLVVDWDAPSGAAKYHITYTLNGGTSWLPGAYGLATTNLHIAVAGNKPDTTYIVGVRAGNATGWGPWRNSEPVPPE